ncbi:unnamed protein product [Rotaria magnacalcarata]|uniref:Heat shock protein 70 n=3 Tax=Rotaria magnacalcarata TaxID=392030 RepID=A0A815JGQ5_9BILA|nr:unnamed protein product [Rotaria magnacalcarata]
MSIQCTGIGIDLGTTYSGSGKKERISVFHDGKVKIVVNEEGNPKTSSCVAFTDTQQLIGDAAKNQGVPACFNYSHRRAINDATVMTGLSVQRIISRSTLAGVAFGFQNTFSKERNVLAFDIDGGTCNCTLSTYLKASINIESLLGDIDFKSEITRARFEELCEDLFCDTLKPVINALHDVNMHKSQIHEIVLIGGSTDIPRIQKESDVFFYGKKRNKSINPNQAVVNGAAIETAENIKKVLLAPSGTMIPIIKRNTAIPATQTHTLRIGFNNQTNVRIKIYVGEHETVSNNYLLEELELSDILRVSRDEREVKVEFSMDNTGKEENQTAQREEYKLGKIRNMCESLLTEISTGSSSTTVKSRAHTSSQFWTIKNMCDRFYP